MVKLINLALSILDIELNISMFAYSITQTNGTYIFELGN